MQSANIISGMAWHGNIRNENMDFTGKTNYKNAAMGTTIAYI